MKDIIASFGVSYSENNFFLPGLGTLKSHIRFFFFFLNLLAIVMKDEMEITYYYIAACLK